MLMRAFSVLCISLCLLLTDKAHFFLVGSHRQASRGSWPADTAVLPDPSRWHKGPYPPRKKGGCGHGRSCRWSHDHAASVNKRGNAECGQLNLWQRGETSSQVSS